MVSIKCPKCKGEIPDDESLVISGTANVKGMASLRGFHDEGVIWQSRDSWDEEFKCPHCGKYFTPNFEKLREEWEKTEV